MHDIKDVKRIWINKNGSKVWLNEYFLIGSFAAAVNIQWETQPVPWCRQSHRTASYSTPPPLLPQPEWGKYYTATWWKTKSAMCHYRSRAHNGLWPCLTLSKTNSFLKVVHEWLQVRAVYNDISPLLQTTILSYIHLSSLASKHRTTFLCNIVMHSYIHMLSFSFNQVKQTPWRFTKTQMILLTINIDMWIVTW